MPPPVSRRSRTRRILWLSALVAAALAGAYFFRRPLFERSIAVRIEKALADGLGGTWRVDSVDGGWISDAAVSGVHLVVPAADGRLRAFDLDRAAVEYSAFGIVGGAKALTSLRVTGLTVEVDLTRTGASSEPAPSPPASTGSPLDDLPAALRLIEIDARVAVRVAAGHNVAGSLEVRGDVHGIDMEMRDIDAPYGVHAPSWRARIDRNGRGRLDLASSDSLGGVELRRMTLDLAAAPARIEAEAAVAGGTVRFDVAGGRVRAEFAQVDLARLPPWVPGLAETELPSAGVVGAELDVAVDGAATVRAHGRGVVVRGLPPADLDATVDFARRPFVVAGATVACAGVRLAARGLVVDPADAWIVVEAAEAVVETDDLAASLRTLGVDAHAFDGEGPVRTRLTLSRDRSGPVRVIDAGVNCDGAVVNASGTVALPGRPKDWRDATLEIAGAVSADLAATSAARRLGTKIEGRLESKVRLDGSATAPRIDVDATLRGALIEGLVLDLAHARATLSGDALDVAELTVSAAQGTVHGSGRVVLSTGDVADAKFEADVPDVSALLPASAGGVGLRGRARAKAEIRRRGGKSRPAGLDQWLEGVEGTFGATGERIEVHGLALNETVVEGSIRGRAVSVDSLRVSTDGVSARATFTADLMDAALRDVTAAVQIDDASGVVRALTGTADVRGSGAVEIRSPTLSTDLDALEGALAKVALRDVEIGGSRIGTVTLDASVAAGTIRFAASADGADATAAVRGAVSRPNADRFVLRLDEATAHAADRDVRLVAPAEIRAGDGRADLDGAEFDVGGTKVRLRGSVGESIDIDAAAEGVDLSRFVHGASGRADLRVTVGGTATDARLVVDAAFSDVSRGGIDGTGLTGALHVAASQDADGIHVTEATLDATPSLRATATLSLPWFVGSSGVRRVAERAPAGTVTVRTEAVAEWARRAGLDELDASSAEVRASLADGTTRVAATAPGVIWMPFGRPDLAVAGSIVLSATADATTTTVSFDGLADTGSTATGTFRLDAGLDWTDLPGALARAVAAPLSGEIKLDVPDLSARRPRMPGLSPLNGHVFGGATIGGTPESPTMRGVVEATGLAVGILDDARAFDSATARVSFEGREIRIESIDGRLGCGPVHVDGILRLPAGSVPVADLRARGENVLLFQDDAMRLRSDLVVAVKGPIDALDVSGELRLRDSLFSVTLDSAGGGSAPTGDVTLFSLGDAPVGRAKLDLHVTAESAVRIVGERVRGAASVDLRIRGTGAHPEPEGRIECPGLRVFLPFTRITLESGVVEFPHGRPFNPRIRAVAECRARGYDVTVRVTGDVPDIDLDITSIPALTREQALVLLTTGASPDDVSRKGSGNVAISRAQSLVASELFAQIARPSDPTERGVLDRVSIEFTSGESAHRTDSFEASYELSDDFRLQLERDRYLDYIFGVVWRLRFR